MSEVDKEMIKLLAKLSTTQEHQTELLKKMDKRLNDLEEQSLVSSGRASVGYFFVDKFPNIAMLISIILLTAQTAFWLPYIK